MKILILIFIIIVIGFAALNFDPEQSPHMIEIREIQRLYNAQDFEALYYRSHKERRPADDGDAKTEERNKRRFIDRKKTEYEQRGKIIEAELIDSGYRFRTRPKALYWIYRIKFEKTECRIRYEFIIEGYESKFYEYNKLSCGTN